MKTNFEFTSALALRTPLHTWTDFRPGIKALPLHDPRFRAALLTASPVVYRELEKVSFNGEALPPRLHLTLVKYWNRICFRPIPFGLFAGTSLTRWDSGEPAITMENSLKIRAQLSFVQSLRLAGRVLKDIPADEKRFVTNPACYRVQKEYRYLYMSPEAGSGNRRFFVRAAERNAVLNAVMRYCRQPHNLRELTAFLKDRFAVDDASGLSYLQMLVENQVLLNTLSPNITGTDYLERLCRLSAQNGLKPETDAVRQAIHCLERLNDLLPDQMAATLDELHRSSLLQAQEQTPFYINTGIHASGALPDRYQQQIRDGIYCIGRLTEAKPQRAMTQFAEAFRNKFDQQMVPLMVALDPETGVAYDGMGSSHHSPVLLKDLPVAPRLQAANQDSWTPAHALLLRKYAGSRTAGGGTIHISDEDLAGLPAHDVSLPGSPSISAMFRLCGDCLFLGQTGGPTATALTGRFTPLLPEALAWTREIAAREEQANPDVIFAELAHIGEAHTANIDRREVIRRYEIPVMTSSALPDERQIPLSDLAVSLSGNELWLWSVRYRKRVIPRLSSAYNYIRTDLAVFRFLCDLQHQGIRTAWRFVLEDFLPGLDHYPRVQYKSTIISLATWKIPAARIRVMRKQSPEQQQVSVKNMFEELRIHGYISLIEHDHQLVFNVDQHDEMRLFTQILLQAKDNVTLQEFPFAEHQTKLVNEQGQPRIGQFIAALVNPGRVYAAMPMPKRSPGTITRKFISGSPWLYVKLYCHPSAANELLIKQVQPFIRSLGTTVQQWFFIRYSDPGFHIRVRLRVTEDEKVLSQLKKYFGPLVQSGIVGRLKLDTYDRELERYTPELIGRAEQFFHASSEVILAHIAAVSADESSCSYYQAAVSGLHLIASVMLASTEKQERMLGRLHDAFAKEFQADDRLREGLKAKYRELKDAGLFTSRQLHYYKHVPRLARACKAFIQTLAQLKQETKQWDEARLQQLTGDLMHMHLNRLFTEKPREQEMVCYYCLSKWYYEQIRRKQYENA